MKTTDKKRSGKIKTLVLLLSIAAIVFLSFADILDDYFSGIDTFTLIEGSRIRSGGDVARILTERMNSGTAFKKTTRFYRPVSSFSYSIDYFIWKLNPFGYHFTDLLLHLCASLLVFLVIRSLTGGEQTMAWLGAVLFSLHPILTEIIPAIARRHDVLATLFLLLAFWMFQKFSASQFKQRSRLVLSAIFFALALGSKEIAVIFPGLVFFYLLLFTYHGEPPVWSGLIRSLKGSAVFFVMSAAFLLWRGYVLQGAGGYAAPVPAAAAKTQSFMGVMARYAADLFVPPRQDGMAFVLSRLLPLLGVLILLLALYLLLLRLFRDTGAVKKILTVQDRPGNPLPVKSLVFSLVWLILPLGVYVTAKVFHSRYMYLSIIPLGMALAILVVSGFRQLRKKTSVSSTVQAGTIILLVALTIAVSLMWYSPMLTSGTGWERSGEMSEMFFRRLSELAPGFPQNAQLDIYKLPSIAYLRRHSIASWLNLNFGEKAFRVNLKSMAKIPMAKTPGTPRQLYLKTRQTGKNSISIYCRIKKEKMNNKVKDK